MLITTEAPAHLWSHHPGCSLSQVTKAPECYVKFSGNLKDYKFLNSFHNYKKQYNYSTFFVIVIVSPLLCTRHESSSILGMSIWKKKCEVYKVWS